MIAQNKLCHHVSDPDFPVEECTINDVQRLSLVPQGQDTCLLVQREDNTALGSLVLQIQSIQMSRISELGDEANNVPGFTRCTDSCGCWACDCFYCTSACLFYRVFAQPTSNTVFQIFSCPVWNFKISMNAVLKVTNGKEFRSPVILEPGVEKTWDKFEFSLIGVTNPPTPILGTKFVTDGKRTAKVDASPSGQPTSGQIGALQCSNREDASNFKGCSIPLDICSCDPREEKVNCQCSATKIENVFENDEYMFPIQMQGLTIGGSGTTVEATMNALANLEIQVTVKDLKLAQIIDAAVCYVKVHKANGCYSCLGGAKVEYTCLTNKGSALAHIRCGQGKFSANCDANGMKQTAILAFDHAKVKEECLVHCPGGPTTFVLEAELMFIDKNRLTDISELQQGEQSGGPGFYPPNFRSFLNWFKSNWDTVLFAVILGIFVLILVFFIVPLIPTCIGKIYNSWSVQMSKLFKRSTHSYKGKISKYY